MLTTRALVHAASARAVTFAHSCFEVHPTLASGAGVWSSTLSRSHALSLARCLALLLSRLPLPSPSPSLPP
eukprot:4551837-Pleurochrysis_carterae.AAC.1